MVFLGPNYKGVFMAGVDMSIDSFLFFVFQHDIS